MVAAALLCLVFSPESLTLFERGELPIVISAPHGGVEAIPGVPERTDKTRPQFATVRDTYTDRLAIEISNEVELQFGKKPWLVVAKFSRKYVDANRPEGDGVESAAAKPYYQFYHASLREAVEASKKLSPRAILLDIHGQGADKERIFRGTRNRLTVRGLISQFGEDGFTGPKSFLGSLEAQKVAIKPVQGEPDAKEEKNFNGGHIVFTYGSNNKDGIDAIQLETGGNFRNKENYKAVAKQIATALKSHYDAFINR